MEKRLGTHGSSFGLEQKFCAFSKDINVSDKSEISGYASLFNCLDQGGDVVQKGAYAASLQKAKQEGRKIKMLWQHDPTQPIGVWDEVYEDDKGLFVKGRLLTDLRQGAEAAALVAAGALDGLSIGYRTDKASKSQEGHRQLCALDLWEVSLVTFPMLPSARIAEKTSTTHDVEQTAHRLTQILNQARKTLRQAL